MPYAGGLVIKTNFDTKVLEIESIILDNTNLVNKKVC